VSTVEVASMGSSIVVDGDEDLVGDVRRDVVASMRPSIVVDGDVPRHRGYGSAHRLQWGRRSSSTETRGRGSATVDVEQASMGRRSSSAETRLRARRNRGLEFRFNGAVDRRRRRRSSFCRRRARPATCFNGAVDRRRRRPIETCAVGEYALMLQWAVDRRRRRPVARSEEARLPAQRFAATGSMHLGALRPDACALAGPPTALGGPILGGCGDMSHRPCDNRGRSREMHVEPR
jgi:hypothetical protein